MLGNRAVYVAVIAVVLLLIAAFVVWLVMRIQKTDRQGVVLSTSVVKLSTATILNTTTVPATVNGQEFTYGFWVYLNSVNITVEPKLVFLRSPNVQSTQGTTVYNNATPVVFMDAGTNRMYISIPTTSMPAGSPSDLTGLMPDTVDASQEALTVQIDYVPLQRWVFIAFAVQDNSVTTFMDGDIYSVNTIADPITGNRPVFTATAGTVQLGDTTNGVDGYLAKLTFANYALTQRQAYEMYRKGPQATTWLSRFGLPPYGIRSPIYKLDAVVN